MFYQFAFDAKQRFVIKCRHSVIFLSDVYGAIVRIFHTDILRGYTLGLSILTNFGKIERTYHLPFQGGSKTTCVNGKVPPTKEYTYVTNYSTCKAKKKSEKELTKLTTGKMRVSRL